MKRYLLLLMLPLLLTGCMSLGGSEKKILVPQKEQIVVMPPAILFTSCPDIPELPSGDDYTQRDVAKLVVKLYKAGKLCKDNLEAVERYLLRAKKVLEKK